MKKEQKNFTLDKLTRACLNYPLMIARLTLRDQLTREPLALDATRCLTERARGRNRGNDIPDCR